MSCESLRVNGEIAIEAGVLECSWGGRNWWCGGGMVRYQEELLLGRQLGELQLTLRVGGVGMEQG